MSEPKKKPGVAFWATIIVVGVVLMPFLYLAALGPTAFLLGNKTISDETWMVLMNPVDLWQLRFGATPQWFWLSFNGYLRWWYLLAAPNPP